MSGKLYKALVQERADLVREAGEIVAAAEREDRGLTDEEKGRDDAIAARLDALAPDIAREEARRAREAAVMTAGTWIVGEQLSVGHDRAMDRPWASFGEFLQAVAGAATPGGVTDARLYQGAASGLSSGVPSDGGFLVQSDYSTALLTAGYGESVLAPRCRRIPIGSNSDGLEAPIIDQTSRAAGSRFGGVQVYRRAEADTVAATKPKFGLFDLRLEDLMGLAYATERLLRDATSLEAVLTQAFAEEFAFTVDNEIIRGDGVGECLGILNAPATVSVAKETGQTAATVVKENIDKMWSRMWARARAGAVWLINQDVEPQLDDLSMGVGTGGLPVYMPPGGLNDTPYSRLKGRPVLPVEQCATLGTVGDIILVNLDEYILIEKGGIEPAESIHVRFIYNERTFRWVYRINGRPKWHSALTPAQGSNTLSPYVTLATRA